MRDGADETAGSGELPLPKVGEVIRRLRQRRGLSIRAVADQAGLSPAFIGAVERGESDIAVGRLARVANVFGHDCASLLGYSLGQARPRFIAAEEQVRLDRGEGVEFTAIRVPGTNLELMVARLAPHAHFNDVVVHAGVDALYVLEGEIVLSLNDVEYPMHAGDSVVWPSSHPHVIYNNSDAPAIAIGVATETVY